MLVLNGDYWELIWMYNWFNFLKEFLRSHRAKKIRNLKNFLLKIFFLFIHSFLFQNLKQKNKRKKWSLTYFDYFHFDLIYGIRLFTLKLRSLRLYFLKADFLKLAFLIIYDFPWLSFYFYFEKNKDFLGFFNSLSYCLKILIDFLFSVYWWSDWD